MGPGNGRKTISQLWLSTFIIARLLEGIVDYTRRCVCLADVVRCYCNCETGAGSGRANSLRSELLWRIGGLLIPSFCILQISVVRLRPSLAAAPFGPPITQALASSVRRIMARSVSLRVAAAGERATGRIPAAGKGLGSTPLLERI